MPRTEQQLINIKNKRKNKILEASLKLFAINGYKAVSIDDIAKASGCAHSLIYHYFETKDQLFLEVIARVKEEMVKLIDSVDYTKSPGDALESLLSNLLGALKVKKPNMPAMIYLLLNLHLQKDGIPKPKDDNKCHHIWHVLIDLIKKGQETGEFNDGEPIEYAIAIVTMLQGLAYKAMYMKNEYFTTPSVTIVMNLVKRKEKN